MMGDALDDHLADIDAGEAQNCLAQAILNCNAEKGVWIGRGVEYQIEDMDTRHLLNSCAMLERNGFDVPDSMQAELNKRTQF